MTIATFLFALLGAMALGAPISFALLICGVALMVQMDNFDTQIIAQNLLEGANNYPLMAVPFFMLAGELMNAGGLSRRVVGAGSDIVEVRQGIIDAFLAGHAVHEAAHVKAQAQGFVCHSP